MNRFGNFASTEAAHVAEAGDFFATGDFYSGKKRTKGAVVLGGGSGANRNVHTRGAMAYRRAQGSARSATSAGRGAKPVATKPTIRISAAHMPP